MNPDTKRMLFDESRKERGFTTQGEMFYGRQLADLARSFDYRAERITENTSRSKADRLLPSTATTPCSCRSTSTSDGNPGLFGGKRAALGRHRGPLSEKDGGEVPRCHPRLDPARNTCGAPTTSWRR